MFEKSRRDGPTVDLERQVKEWLNLVGVWLSFDLNLSPSLTVWKFFPNCGVFWKWRGWEGGSPRPGSENEGAILRGDPVLFLCLSSSKLTAAFPGGFGRGDLSSRQEVCFLGPVELFVSPVAAPGRDPRWEVARASGTEVGGLARGDIRRMGVGPVCFGAVVPAVKARRPEPCGARMGPE